MKKIILGVVLLILLFASSSGSYCYFYEISKTLPKVTKENSKAVTAIPSSTKLEKVTSDSNLEKKQGTMNLSKPGNDVLVKDRPLYGKEIFLTFDDGPSSNTHKILKILEDKDVKATFFVIGENVDKYPELVNTEYKAGMSILNHSYSHEYSMYKSIESFSVDFKKCNTSIAKAIGTEPLPYLRFPGGSDNRVSDLKVMQNIRNEVATEGVKYIDWNVDSGDADAFKVPVDTINKKIIKQVANNNFAVLLMHDAPVKTTTVDALPKIIDYLKMQGFVFRTFTDLTPTEENEMIRKKIIDRGLIK